MSGGGGILSRILGGLLERVKGGPSASAIIGAASVSPFAPRCAIDNLPMHQLGSTTDGHPVFECDMGHFFSPGVDLGSHDPLLDKNARDYPGDI